MQLEYKATRRAVDQSASHTATGELGLADRLALFGGHGMQLDTTSIYGQRTPPVTYTHDASDYAVIDVLELRRSSNESVPLPTRECGTVSRTSASSSLCSLTVGGSSSPPDLPGVAGPATSP